MLKQFKDINPHVVLDWTIVVVSTSLGVIAAGISMIPHIVSCVLLGISEQVHNKFRQEKEEDIVITDYFDSAPIDLIMSVVDIAGPAFFSADKSTASEVLQKGGIPAGCEGEMLKTVSEEPRTEGEDGSQEIHKEVKVVIPSEVSDDKDSLAPTPLIEIVDITGEDGDKNIDQASANEAAAASEALKDSAGQ